MIAAARTLVPRPTGYSSRSYFATARDVETWTLIGDHPHQFHFRKLRVPRDVSALRTDTNVTGKMVVIQHADKSTCRASQNYLKLLAGKASTGKRAVCRKHGERLAKGLLADGRRVTDDH